MSDVAVSITNDLRNVSDARSLQRTCWNASSLPIFESRSSHHVLAAVFAVFEKTRSGTELRLLTKVLIPCGRIL